MNNTNAAVKGKISWIENVEALEVLVLGCLGLVLTYGVIKYGYALEGSWNGFKISLRPA
jgi:hypothetical protein